MTRARRPSSQHRPSVRRPGSTGLRFGMFAVCVTRDSDPGLNKGKAKALYPLLISYSDITSRSTAQGYPYRSALADALDCTKDTVDNATKYLENEIGLIKVVRRKVEGQPDQNDANEYQVFDQWLIQGCKPTPDTPPQLVARYGPTIPGFDVDAWIAECAPSFDLAGWRTAYEATLHAQETKREEQRRKEAQRRKPKKRGGGGTDSATPGGTHSATGGGMSAALSRTVLPEPSSADDDALAGRSPVDGVALQAEVVEDGVEGGCAASGKTAPSPTPHDETRGPAGNGKGGSKKAAHTREQLDVVRQVRALFPPELLNNGLPDLPVLSSAILTAMGEGRTVEQMRDRIWYRWSNHGFADIWAEEGQFNKPVGVAIALVSPLKKDDKFACPDLRCENGADKETKVPCRLCEVRIADRRAERARERGQKRPVGANSAPAGAGSPDPVLPPQRAVQARPGLSRECDGQDGTCGRPAERGSAYCARCLEDAVEHRDLENAGAPAPF